MSLTCLLTRAWMSRSRITISPSTTYQRMLVHRCSAYYKLQPESDTSTKGIAVYYRTESRMLVVILFFFAPHADPSTLVLNVESANSFH